MAYSIPLPLFRLGVTMNRCSMNIAEETPGTGTSTHPVLGWHRPCLDVIVEDQMGFAVSLQQGLGIGQVEVLELQNSIGPPPHHRLHKLVYDLRTHAAQLRHDSSIKQGISTITMCCSHTAPGGA